MVRRFASLILLSVMGAGVCLALPAAGFGKLTGRVNASDGAPLAGATILLATSFDFNRSFSSAVTNRNGEFQLGNLEPGQYALRVTQKGYQSHFRAPVEVLPGTTTTLMLVLQSLAAFGTDTHSENWDFRTVLRSSQDRRMIFRNFENTSGVERTAAVEVPQDTSRNDRLDRDFVHGGAVEITSGGPYDGSILARPPGGANAGLRTNFAYSLPLGEDSRYLLAGQVNSGYDSLWKVRNQVDLKLNDFQVWTFSASYGRLGFPSPRLTTLLNPMNLSRDQEYVTNRGTAQTLTLGIEGYSRILDPLTLICGVDLSVLRDSHTRGFAAPSLQVIVEPTQSLSIRALMSTKRETESDSVQLPTGETVGFGEPFRLSQRGASWQVERSTHYELGMARRFSRGTTLELGTYADRESGSGLYLMAVLKTPTKTLEQAFRMSPNEASAQGIRILVNQRFWEFLKSSVSYVYGSGATISQVDIVGAEAISSVKLSKDFFHAVSAQMDAEFSRTKTQLSTTVRWVPGSPITTLDPYSDYYNMGNSSLRLQVRQIIPVPDLWRMTGRWEALVDLRNILEADDNQLSLSQGQLVVLRNPRLLRLGIAFRM